LTYPAKNPSPLGAPPVFKQRLNYKKYGRRAGSWFAAGPAPHTDK
jgi:hypothetical protein